MRFGILVSAVGCVSALGLAGAASRCASGAGARGRCAPPRAAVYVTNTVRYERFSYEVKVQEASTMTGSARTPPLVGIPPVGVGISRLFFEPLHREWASLGAPAELHTPDLLGCSTAAPKPRTFYSPQVWSAQLLAYINETLQRPAVLLVQGGLLPVALEMWRECPEAIAGIVFCSPPPLRFFSAEALEEVGVRQRFRGTPRAAPGRGQQRALWLLSQSSLGGVFFRYLRGAKGKRIRAFSERNLFHRPENVDEEWMSMCRAGARDTRSRHATFAYLVGTVPGGAWRDDRCELLASIDVPCQVLILTLRAPLSTQLSSRPPPKGRIGCLSTQHPTFNRCCVATPSRVPPIGCVHSSRRCRASRAARSSPMAGPCCRTRTPRTSVI